MITESKFKPAWWLPTGHLQTMWPTMRPEKRLIPLRRERFELPDGDFIDLDWCGDGDGPIVLILHGICGDIDSPYATLLLESLYKKGWRGLFMHFRGESEESNRHLRFYHGGDTTDVQSVIEALIKQQPGVKLAVVGISLGGNILLKWLGEQGRSAPICSAMAISPTFDLQTVAKQLDTGLSKFYQRWLMQQVRDSMQQKMETRAAPYTMEDIKKITNFDALNTHVTAPTFGFYNAADYYQYASCKPYLHKIRIPTLILHANDDPFMTPKIVPTAEELSDSTTLEISASGGHLGFVGGDTIGVAEYWMATRATEYFSEILD